MMEKGKVIFNAYAWLLIVSSMVMVCVESSTHLPNIEFKFLLPVPSSICSSAGSSESRNENDYMLLDDKHRIIMDWTPKAACTKAVEMFWNEMNITRGLFYPENEFIHKYRLDFYAKCGKVSSKLLTNNSFYKFKVVRNPFTRAVSSYLHIMKTKIAHTLLWTKDHSGTRKSEEDRNNILNKLSFEQFLDLYVDQIRPTVDSHRGVALSHVKPQSSQQEWRNFQTKQKSFFNQIVHLETFEQDIEVVNRATGRNYSYPPGDDFHVIHKKEQPDVYFGNVSFPDMLKLHGVPENYNKFYNRRTKRQVGLIFANDLKIYNYSFPYSRFY